MMFGEEEGMSSECSSGCQSGWTMYLDESSYDAPSYSLVYNKSGFYYHDEEEEEEEDLSMVSDASSGPPHFHENTDEHYYNSCQQQYCSSCCQGNGCLCSALSHTPYVAASAPKDGGNKRVEAEKQKQKQQQQHCSLLDDTASSPLYSQPKASFNEKNNDRESVLEFSCGFSATHFKGKSALQNQMGYLQSPAHHKQTATKPVLPRKESGKM